jgi:hypothetical protein
MAGPEAHAQGRLSPSETGWNTPEAVRSINPAKRSCSTKRQQGTYTAFVTNSPIVKTVILPLLPTAGCHLSVAGNENGGNRARSLLLLLQGRNKWPYHQQRLAARGFRRSPRGMRQVRTERSEGKRSTDLHEQYLLHFRLASPVLRS